MNRIIAPIIVSLALLLPCYGLVTEHTNSVSLTLANVCDGSFNDFNFKVSGYDSQKFKFTYDVSLAGLDCVFRITKPIQGTIYLDVPVTDITVATSNITWTISRTNIPPPGNYYGELLSYDAGTTNVYRSLAQGKLPVTWSLYLNETNYFQRSTTNAAVGQVYIHPSWVYPPWTSSTNLETLWISASNKVVYTNDSRLTDARVPLAHNQGYITITDAPWISGYTETDSIATNLITAHTTNTQIHVLATDKTNWDGKATLADVAGAGYITNAASGDSNAVWGNISGTLANQLDLTSTVAKAASALQSYTETDPIATNMIIVASNYFAANKISTNGSGAGLTGITAAQVGAVPTNDASVTNARPWDSPNYLAITNPPEIPSTNGLASTNWVLAQGYTTNASAGSGSGFPLTNNANLAGFSMTNGSFVGNGNGLTNTTWHTVSNTVVYTNNPNLLNAAEKNVATNISNRVQKTGDIMTGPLTNNVLFAGNGAGLTNAPYGDVYLSSNNIFGTDSTQRIQNASVNVLEIETAGDKGAMQRTISREGDRLRVYQGGPQGMYFSIGTNAFWYYFKQNAFECYAPAFLYGGLGANVNGHGFTISNSAFIGNGAGLTNITSAQVSGVITGATVTESSSASSVTTNAGVLTFNVRTNASGGTVSYGTTAGTAYEGNNGATVSNIATNAQSIANAALPKAGGTMTGALTNNVAIWLPANGIVYFGTATNYIKDQAGTNFIFVVGTNSANFAW